MAEQQLNILLILRDQLSPQMKNATSAVANFNQSCIHLGRQLQQVGRNMTFVGAGTIAPFVAAMNNAKASSFSVATTLNVTSANMERFNTILAESAVPVTQRFNAILSSLVDIYEKMDPALRENITTWTLVAGAIMVASGAVLLFVGAVTKLVPILAALALAFKALQFVQNVIQQGWSGAWNQAAADFQNALDTIQSAAQGFTSGKFVDDMKDMASKIKEAFSDGAEKGAAKAETAFMTLRTVSMDTAKQIAQAFKTNLGNTLFDFITGKIHGLRSAIAAFGEDLMRIAAQAIAVFALRASLNAAVPGLGSLLFFHSGGMVYPRKAHGGLAPDEVPIIAQTGEGVLSRRGMSALGGSDRLRRLNRGEGMGGDGGTTISPIVVVQAWDTSDIMRNRKTLEAIIANSIARNGEVRKAMKLYG